MELVPARQIVTRTGKPGGFYGYDYNMNLYRGCCHGCIYCDSRSDCYRVENFDQVRGKKDALEIVARELRSKHRTGVVSTGAMSDPYNPFEEEYELTRGRLELIDRYGFGISVLTQSPLVARDAGLYQRISHHSLVSAKMTVTTADDELSKIIEPHVAPSSVRFGAIRALSDAGLFTGIAVVPVLPFLTDSDENIRGLVELAAASGARYVYLETGVTLRMNQQQYFYNALDKHFPGLKEEYVRGFGSLYRCITPRHREVRRTLADHCKRNGLLYRLNDILAAQREPYQQPQLSLFL